MRQAIETRYLGATNTRGSRVVARSEAARIVISWDDSLNSTENHKAAAHALVRKMGWGWLNGAWHGGASADGRGYCFVWAARERRAGTRMLP